MKTDVNKLRELAKERQINLLGLRSWFHSNPDLRWEENETLEQIERICGRMLLDESISMTARPRGGGLVIDITVEPQVHNELDRILFRADVDAIPVEEKTNLPFASKKPGVMHACGHDAHIAMLLEAARVICSGKVKLKHNIRLVFQRAEENPGSPPNSISGGKTLVDEGICNGIGRVYGLHIMAPYEPGIFRCREGAMLGNSDRLEVIIKTSGGHVALPEGGINAIRVAHSVQSLLMRYDKTNTRFEPSVILAGTKKATNVMPGEANLYFGARNFLPPGDREMMLQRIADSVRSVSDDFPGTQIEVNPIWGHPAAINDADSVRHVSSLLAQAGETTTEQDRIAGGDDLAYYLQQCPGSYWILGANKPGAGDHHSPTFDIDESVMWKGVLFWLLLATN